MNLFKLLKDTTGYETVDDIYYHRNYILFIKEKYQFICYAFCRNLQTKKNDLFDFNFFKGSFNCYGTKKKTYRNMMNTKKKLQQKRNKKKNKMI